MHSVVISQVFVSSVIFLMIGWSMALLFDLPAVISSSSVPHIMNWAVKFMSFLTTPMLSKLSLSSGRVKVLPWNHRVCDFRLHGSSLRGCIDNPEILLPSQVSAHSSSVSVRSPPHTPHPDTACHIPFIPVRPRTGTRCCGGVQRRWRQVMTGGPAWQETSQTRSVHLDFPRRWFSESPAARNKLTQL